MNNLQHIKTLINDAHYWQYKEINLTGRKYKYYFSNTQFLIILVSLLLNYVLPKGFSNNFSGYVVTCFSIFTGLYLNLIVIVFDKSKDKIESYKNESNLKTTLEQRNHIVLQINYLRKISSLSLYCICISIIIIMFFLTMILFENFNINLSDFTLFDFKSLPSLLELLYFIVFFSTLIFRTITLYLVLNFFVISFYIVTSMHLYFKNEYSTLERTVS